MIKNTSRTWTCTVVKICKCNLSVQFLFVTEPGLPTGCPTVTEKKCTTNEQCRDNVSGMMGRCNMEKKLCCDVSADGGKKERMLEKSSSI